MFLIFMLFFFLLFFFLSFFSLSLTFCYYTVMGRMAVHIVIHFMVEQSVNE